MPVVPLRCARAGVGFERRGDNFRLPRAPRRNRAVRDPPHELQTPIVAKADAHGAYELCVPIGEAPLVVVAPGYAPTPDFIDAGGRTRHDIRLVRGAPLDGRVVRAIDMSLVPGALVEVREAPSTENPPIQTVVSDERGMFHLDAVTPGKHFVTATADRMATQHAVETVVGQGGPNRVIDCELVAAPTVSGKVVDAKTHQPLAGERVHLRPAEADGGWDDGGTAISGDDGSFLVERVRPGEYSLLTTGRHERDPATTAQVEGVDVVGLVLEVEPRASVEGRVLAGGVPVEGAFVRIGPRSTYSDADGRYVLDRLPEGTHGVAAHAWRVGAHTSGPAITLAGGERKTMDVVLDLAGTISGVLVDQDGAPVGGASVSFVTADGSTTRSATSADDGTFVVRTQTSGAAYSIDVRPREHALATYPVVAGAEPLRVSLADNTSRVTGLRLQVSVDQLEIAGRVVDPAGSPVANAQVSAAPRELHRLFAPPVSTDASGAFTMHGLEPDTYTLRATTAGAIGDADGVAAGAKGVTISLRAKSGPAASSSR